LTDVLDERHLVLISIVLQLIDHAGDIDEMNPNIQEYLQGLCDEFNDPETTDDEQFNTVYYYADTFFNKLYGAEETLH